MLQDLRGVTGSEVDARHGHVLAADLARASEMSAGEVVDILGALKVEPSGAIDGSPSWAMKDLRAAQTREPDLATCADLRTCFAVDPETQPRVLKHIRLAPVPEFDRYRWLDVWTATGIGRR